MHFYYRSEQNEPKILIKVRDNGLIRLISHFSSEYLFLLTVLIKPQSGFKIAFAMLDRDGNDRIDKSEFKVNRNTTHSLWGYYE